MNIPKQNYGSISTPTVGFSGAMSSEFNSSCDNVTTNIYTINTTVRTLENAHKNIGTKKDTQDWRNNIHETQLRTNQIASETSKEIKNLKVIVTKGNDKQKRLQVEKLEEDFKEAVNRYYNLQKDVVNKQKTHPLMSTTQNETAQEDDYNQEQQLLSKELQVERNMALLERENRIKQLEQDTIDINEIMRNLGELVHSQGESVDAIENNIDNAAVNVEAGTEQLLKASRYQVSYRKKLLFLVLIGLIIVAIVIGILVSQLKS